MYCYGSGAGYGRFIDRVEQPLFVPGQKGTDKSGTRKATSCRHVRCVETGEVFEKVSDIGKLCPSYDLDKLVPCILNAMRTGNRSLGHKWVRVTDEQYVEYIEQNQKLLETLRDNPAAKEHGSLAAARLPKEAQCGCAKCAMARNGAHRRARCLRYVRSVGSSRCCAHREGELRGCRDDSSPLKDRQGGSEPLRRKPQAG